MTRYGDLLLSRRTRRDYRRLRGQRSIFRCKETAPNALCAMHDALYFRLSWQETPHNKVISNGRDRGSHKLPNHRNHRVRVRHSHSVHPASYRLEFHAISEIRESRVSRVRRTESNRGASREIYIRNRSVWNSNWILLCREPRLAANFVRTFPLKGNARGKYAARFAWPVGIQRRELRILEILEPLLASRKLYKEGQSIYGAFSHCRCSD